MNSRTPLALARNLDLRALAGDQTVAQRIPVCPPPDRRAA